MMKDHLSCYPLKRPWSFLFFDVEYLPEAPRILRVLLEFGPQTASMPNNDDMLPMQEKLSWPGGCNADLVADLI